MVYMSSQWDIAEGRRDARCSLNQLEAFLSLVETSWKINTLNMLAIVGIQQEKDNDITGRIRQAR